MVADPETIERPSPPRGEENVLGAGTTPRFLLLLALIGTSGATMIETMHEWWSGRAPGLYDCFLAAGWDSGRGYGINMAVLMGANHDAFVDCIARFAPPWWLTPVLAAPPVVAAAVLYWWLPAWRARARRVVEVTRLDPTGGLSAALRELVGAAGVRRAPRFVVDPVAATTSAVVFGRPGKYTVCLHGGLIARRGSDPEGFRAVVLHELAHLRNRDVDITYVTVALWRVLLVVVVPYLVWSGIQLYRGLSAPAADATVGRYALMVGFTVVLGYLTRADLLRTREIHADLAAVGWGATTGIWGPATPPTPSTPPAGSTVVGRWRGAISAFPASFGAWFSELWRTHPRWQRRRESLTDPAALFGLHPVPSVLTGITTALVAEDLELPGASWWAGGLAGAVVGIALWRAVAYAVRVRRPVPSGVATGCWLGLGFLAAQLVGPGLGGFQWFIARPTIGVVLLLLGVLAGGWTAACARLWASTLTQRTNQHTWGRLGWPVLVLTLAGLVVLLAAGLGWWHDTGALYAQDWSLPGNLADSWTHLAAPRLSGPAENPVRTAMRIAVLGTSWGLPIVWAGTALWLIPLLAWGLPSRAALPPLSRVARDGLAGAVISWCTSAAALAYLHAFLIPTVPAGAPAWDLAQAFLMVSVPLGPGLIAVLAATRASEHRLVVAVVAAGIAALLGGAGTQALISADGCVPPLAVLGTGCQWHGQLTARWAEFPSVAPSVLGAGLITAAGLATVVSVLVPGLTSRRATSRGIPPPHQPSAPGQDSPPAPDHVRRGPARLAVSGAVTALCVVTLALVATVQPLPSGPTHGTLHGVTFTTGPPPSPQVWRAQLAAWNRLGGHDLLTRLTRQVNTVETNPISQAQTPIDDPSPTGHAALEQLRATCTALTTLATDSERYFRIPDPDAEQAWSHATGQLHRAGADCQRALDQRDPALLHTATDTVLDASHQTESMLNHLANRLQAN